VCFVVGGNCDLHCTVPFRLHMDVTDKASISKAKKFIEEKEGRLHILVNKLRCLVSYVDAFDLMELPN
jgi:NAD(P)-dependent dehydrogenase (short-subunit alcohol dehydrogenase family)